MLNTIYEALANLVPFIIALVVLVIGNTLAGALLHANNDFNWGKLLKGCLKWLGILVVILCMLVSLSVYEPLMSKYANEFEVFKEALIVTYFVKVCVQAYELTGVKKSDTLETSDEEIDDELVG